MLTQDFDILPVGFETERLCMVVDRKKDLITKENRRVRILCINLRLHKKEKTVFARQTDIPKISRVGFAIQIDAEIAPVLHCHRRDIERLFVGIIEFDGHRDTAHTGENSIETKGIDREYQAGSRVCSKTFLTRKEQERKEKQYVTQAVLHLFEIEGKSDLPRAQPVERIGIETILFGQFRTVSYRHQHIHKANRISQLRT